MMRRLASLAAALALVVLTAGASLGQGNAPVAVADYATLEEDSVVVLYPLLNDTDPLGGSLELTGISSTNLGDTRVDGAAVVFTPSPDFNGELELAYTVRSAGGESSGSLFLEVIPVNDAPVATNDAANAVAGSAIRVAVLANDSDVDQDEPTITTVETSPNGSATVSGDELVYTAAAGFSGLDELTYTITDPSGATDQATLTVAVTLPRPPSTSVPPASTAAPPTTVAPTTSIMPTPTAPPTTVAPTTSAPPTTAGFLGEVTSPAWAAPVDGLIPTPGTGNGDGLLSSMGRTLESLYLPVFTLLVVGVCAWLLTQHGRSSGRRFAVVLVGLDDTLAVRERPSATAAVVHRFEGSARQIDVIGRRRSVDGVAWVPVSSPGGQGWVEEYCLTEDVAKVSFENDVITMDVVRELRRKLREGSTIGTSPRGPIDPERFERDPTRRQIGGHATAKVAALIGDWRATFHVDRTASLAALRPPSCAISIGSRSRPSAWIRGSSSSSTTKGSRSRLLPCPNWSRCGRGAPGPSLCWNRRSATSRYSLLFRSKKRRRDGCAGCNCHCCGQGNGRRNCAPSQ